MKKVKYNGIIIAVLSAIIIWFLLRKNFEASITLLFNCNLLWLALGIVFFTIDLFIESFIFMETVKKMDKEYDFIKALKLNIMSKFFNGITPFASGGQPLMVLELTKENIKASDATILVVIKFIIFQVAVSILGIIAFIINAFYPFLQGNLLIYIFLAIGFIINFGSVILIFVISKNFNSTKKVIITIANFLFKIKAVKNKEKLINKANTFCDEYYNGYGYILKEKKFLIQMILIDLLSILFYFSVALFVFKSLNPSIAFNFYICLFLSVFTFFVGSFVPIPGGTGGIEYAFITLFEDVVGETLVLPGVVLYRFITYYLPIFTGWLVYIFKKNNYLKQ